jgi:rSAM/selenodomain-associated transferase 1
MTTERHLVVFAKAPRFGKVKRRLAAGIGRVAAHQFYRASLARFLRLAAGDRRWRCWLAATPDQSAFAPRLWPLPKGREVLMIPQGPGDIGDRMGRMFALLPPGPVVIVGADIPTVRAAMIARAFEALRRHGFVFGPAKDGGYWLVGASAAARDPKIFENVRWSTAHALDDTLANLPESATAGFVDTLEDIDDEAAWRRWRVAQRR